MRVNDLIDKYIAYKLLEAPTLGASLLEKLRTIRQVFGELDAETDGVEFAEIASQHWDGKAPATRQRILVQVRAIRNFGYRSALIGRPTPIPLPYVNNTRYVDISPEQLHMILEVAKRVSPWAYPSLLLLAHTGARLGEAMRFTYQDIRSDGKAIVIHKPVGRKTKTIERVVPLTKELRCLFQCGAVPFLYPDGKRIPNHNEASRVLGKALKVCCEILGYQELRLHDLRHAYAALIASYGGDLADIASALGHSNLQMTMRYRGLVRNKLESIVEKI